MLQAFKKVVNEVVYYVKFYFLLYGLIFAIGFDAIVNHESYRSQNSEGEAASLEQLQN